jgi:long-subunit acyl-CoA synthetase (AMP-forming)
VPIVHFYGPKELRYILSQSRARVLVTANRFARQDYLAGLEALRPDLPTLEHVVVVRAEKGDALPAGVEHPSTTGSKADEPREKRHHTDGKPLPGVELRLLDPEGQEAGVEEPGEIWSRGPDLCAGYTDPALNEAFDSEGWYRTRARPLARSSRLSSDAACARRAADAP